MKQTGSANIKTDMTDMTDKQTKRQTHIIIGKAVKQTSQQKDRHTLEQTNRHHNRED